MSYVWQRWLAAEFRAAGLEVIEIDGWENRGRPASTGHYDPTVGVTTHHTGSTSTPVFPQPSLQTLITGRSDLPGPLCQWAVDYYGRVLIIAAGRANHAGPVGKSVPFAAIGADGNAIFLGDEVMTNGTQPLPQAQRDAIAITNAVALHHQGHGAERAHRHADISGSGKWDIGQLTTTQLRDDAERALEEYDMPTPEEIARAVWNTTLQIGGEPVRAGRVLAAIRNQTERVLPKLAELEKTADALADTADDLSTKAQARKIRQDLAELRTALEQTPEDGETDADPRP